MKFCIRFFNILMILLLKREYIQLNNKPKRFRVSVEKTRFSKIERTFYTKNYPSFTWVQKYIYCLFIFTLEVAGISVDRFINNVYYKSNRTPNNWFHVFWWIECGSIQHKKRKELYLSKKVSLWYFCFQVERTTFAKISSKSHPCTNSISLSLN